MDWDGNNASKQEYGYVNVPYNYDLAALIDFPTTENCRPPAPQWLEYDDMRIWSQG